MKTLGFLVSQAFAAETSRFDDPYVAAGRADPHSLAVCRIQGQQEDGKGKLFISTATGALVNINGSPVVITCAHILNPKKVEFPGANNHVSQHTVVRAVSMWTDEASKQEKPDVQVLFLDWMPDVTPLELSTTAIDGSDLKTIGYGTYYTQASKCTDGESVINVTGHCTALIKATVPVKVQMPSNSKIESINGFEQFLTTTVYTPDPSSLETHVFSGFSGAPVIDLNGKVVSIITHSSNPAAEAVRAERKIISNLVGVALLGVGVIRYGVPQQKWTQIAGTTFGLGCIVSAAHTYFNQNKNDTVHLNLSSDIVQNWLGLTIFPTVLGRDFYRWHPNPTNDHWNIIYKLRHQM